ncbi:MAG: hypothetical protein A3G41_01065 [Elusimicrobia bacterium RIFCSPLOWO2_12_FULL_59_9]|nr:MAG: hypothetical protein A3G41_01065 [Elusimicrobia bacterium RIFCSPLOWO2_12_FULL_59_9]
MSFEFFIAERYLKAKRKGLFAMVTTSIGVAGIMIGVAALVTTLAVMNGFHSDIRKKIVGAQAHVAVYGDAGPASLSELEKTLQKEKDIVAWSPFSLGQVILTVSGRSLGVVVKGIDLDRTFAVNDLRKSLIEGDWEKLRMKALPGAPERGIVLGNELAKNLGAWLGDEVLLVSPKGMETPMGMVPKMEKFRVAGLVQTGYYEFDNSMAYLNLSSAERFFGPEFQASGIEIRLSELEKADAVARRLQEALGGRYSVRSFSQMNKTLFAALKLEKTMMFIILTLIVLVAAFNIASNLILFSMEKTRDIGILKAMGATPRSIWKIFCWEGVLIGGLGVAAGVALGLGLSWFIGRYPIVRLPADVYYISKVPVAVDFGDVAAVALWSFVLCVLATLYPAYKASRVDPVEAIHYG